MMPRLRMTTRQKFRHRRMVRHITKRLREYILHTWRPEIRVVRGEGNVLHAEIPFSIWENVRPLFEAHGLFPTPK